MMMDECIYTYILFMGRWITFGRLGNYGATFGKMHRLQLSPGVLWPETYFSYGGGHVWQFVKRGERGASLVKKCDIFCMAPIQSARAQRVL